MAQRHPPRPPPTTATATATGGGEDACEDPMVRDGKELPLAGRKAILPFLATVALKLPLLGVLLPVAVAWRLATALLPAPAPPPAPAPGFTGPAAAAAAVVPLAERPYDIVLVGATGFTGRLAARYLAERYGTTVKWAIAGRQRSKLEAIRAELEQLDLGLASLPLLVVDVVDPGADLAALARSTRVLLTTVGPFEAYGGPLVAACAHHGTAYCDITGEAVWVRRVAAELDGVARGTGARIVNCCGMDCVPSDLLVQCLAAELRTKHGESLAKVECFDELKGGFSGGTVATIIRNLTGRPGSGADKRPPAEGAPAAGPRATFRNPLLPRLSHTFGRWVGPFLLALANFQCVKRSNGALRYGDHVVYEEAVVYANFLAAVSANVDLALFLCVAMIPPLHRLLPQPGEGPSPRAQATGFLKLTAIATGDKGSRVTGTLYFPTDVGYSSTARMLVEAGLALLTPEVSAAGGVLTPAACQGPALLRRLVDTGCWLRVVA